MNLMYLALNMLWLSAWFQIYTETLIHTNFSFRKEDQAQGSQEVQILPFAPVVSSETSSHTLGLGRGLSESSIGEPLEKDSNGDNVLTPYVPEVKEWKI